MTKNFYRISLVVSAAILASLLGAKAQDTTDGSTLDIPERTIVLTGDKQNADKELIAVLYSREDLHFQDPGAPRFLFLDREGKLAFGIGGYVKGQMQYDFDGAIDNEGFVTYNIPVPLNPAERNRFGADASHSTIFFKLVGKTKLGWLNVYVQTNFTGDDDNYGWDIKQAYVSLGNVTAGLARSTFVDAAAQPPTIDDEGPSGATCTKTVLVRYQKKWTNGFSGAISAEFPKTSYTYNSTVGEIAQRCPDIPIYVQYAWDGGQSHIRLSGLLRNLSYRNLVKEQNEWKTGWGAQVSGMWYFGGAFTFFYQGAYGQGYSQFINDLSGNDMDLLPSTTAGKMEAPKVLGVLGGLQYQINPKCFVSASYSQAHLYDRGALDNSTYRYGQYIVANCFYNVLDDMSVGIEYLHGIRTDFSGRSGHANRIAAAVQYNF